MEELQASLQPRGLTLSTFHDKGRSLLAARDFYPGEVIISQEPYVCVPNNSLSESRCDGCFSKSNLKKCSACHVVWYCGSSCQKLEWKLHRLECQLLAKLDKERRKSVTPTIRMMVKLYLRRKLQNGNVIPVTAMDNYNLVEALVSHLQEAIVLYKNIEKLQKEVYHPFSIILLRTREKLLEILMQLEEWKEALTICRLTIPVYERFYPGFHPLLGLQYYSCGKLEWLLGETDDAIKSFTKAVDILRITHGTSTPFMKELLMKLEEARAEALFKLSSREDS
ncbi:hypothetical protein E1A91_A02G084200v1 [Gossypium mustelinum]|uniref:MYND-type domain-containing protein n=1 Tax=Gossypium mustelinum TaxID=34275 RepID=A0A5D3A7K0_GOSMU|nr:hypothetical protein E1A91_A02G084200v1 [Gossypium mustelinum]